MTDPAKRALPGLLVTLSGRSEPDILRVTGTNEKGQYLFQELPPGVYDLKVQAAGFQDAGKERIEIRPPFQNIVDVRLQPCGQDPPPAPAGGGAVAPDWSAPAEDAPAPPLVTVRGRFVDQDKRPLVEVSVVLASLQGNGIHQAFSGDEGTFEIPGIVPGRYRVNVRSPGHVPLDLRSVEILGRNGLSVSLMLVDYPLNFKAGQEARMPLEEPRPAPAPPLTDGNDPAAQTEAPEAGFGG